MNAIVRVSFQSSVTLTQQVNKLLVGHAQNASHTGVFTRISTGTFASRDGADPEAVGNALASVFSVIATNTGTVDSVWVVVTNPNEG